MRVNVLAGSRRRNLPATPPEPQYRWTLTTWIKREARGYNNRRLETIQDKRTVTVMAPSEEAAKAKIEAALPPTPRDVEPRWRDDYEQKRYTREWALEGTIEEVR